MKRTLSFILALAMMLSLALPAFADSDLPQYYTDSDGIDHVLCNVGFHHDGRVRPDGWTKDLVLDLIRIDDINWRLVSEDFVCPICGSFEWISQSNQNGVFNGKNIQLWHPGEAGPKFSSLEINTSAIMNLETATNYEIWQKYFTPHRKDIQWVSEAYSSVTATYANYLDKLDINAKNGKVTEKKNEKVIVPNSNHFTYAAFTLADLQAGVDLALVVGNKLDYVGAASIIVNADGKLELTIDDEIYSAKWGFVAFNDSFAIPKNGNIHSDKLFGGHASNYVYDLPAAGKDGKIYIYVHFDSLQFAYELEKGAEKWVEKYEEFIKTKTVTNKETFVLTVETVVYECNDLNHDCAIVHPEDLIDPDDYVHLPVGTYKVISTIYDLDGVTVIDEIVDLVDLVEGTPTVYEWITGYDIYETVSGGIIYKKPNIWNPLVITTVTKVKK